jgi:8-oxo-dGTP pyrophosphatase MutT (NUDIX family)
LSDTAVRDDQLPVGAGQAGDVPVIPAASTIVMRGNPFEVLMMRRHEKSTFVPGAWVFPGGVMEKEDVEVGRDLFGDDTIEANGLRLCALRELFEEAGVWLGTPLADPRSSRIGLLAGATTVRDLVSESIPDISQLVLTARWITPVGVPKRFDTWFFLALAAPSTEGTPELSEGMELAWMRPSEALARHARGELPMVFPTMKNLEAIAGFDSAADLLALRRKASIPVTRPVLVVKDGKKSIILPEES